MISKTFPQEKDLSAKNILVIFKINTMDTNRTLDEIEIELDKNNNNICGNCDAFCECSLGNNGAKQDDPDCEYFDDTILKQLKQQEI